MLKRTIEVIPMIKDRIKHVSIGTSLSSMQFYNRYTPYGDGLNMAKFTDTKLFLRGETKIDGLRLAG